MFDFINRLFPDNTKPPKTIDVKNTYIKYGITTTIDMKVKGANGSYEGRRKNAFLGNKSSFVGLHEAVLIQDPGIYDGMNKTIIGPNGEPSYMLAEEMLRKQNAWRNEITRVRSTVEENFERTNLVGVIYNMLRMYYIKRLRAMKATPMHKYYDDGHISMSNKQLFGLEDEITLWESIRVNANAVEIAYSHKPAAIYNTEVFYDLGSRPDPILVTLLKHCHAEWENRGPFLIAHSSPQLNEKIVIVGGKIPDRVPELVNISAAEIRACIGEFVRKNSCYRDFEYAYGMITSVITKPVPRSAESVIWHTKPLKVRIPQPCCIRGLAPELYSGSQYARSADWQDTFYSWFHAPMSGVIHSIALQEAVYTELFHLTRVTNYDDIDRDSFMSYATNLADCPNAGIMVDLVLAALRYGREYTLPYITSAGVDRIDSIPGLIEQRLSVTMEDPEAPSHYPLTEIAGEEATLNVGAYAPVTYPSLSYGVNEDGYYMNADHTSVTVKHTVHEGLMIFTDTTEFSKYMSMMRMFGYDVTAISRFSGKKVRNWSDNASGRYIYIHDPSDVAPYFTINWKDIRKRANSWMELPTMYGDVTFSYSLGPKALTWFSGDERMGFASSPITAIKRTEFEKAVTSLTQSRPTIKIIPLHRRSDFRVTRLSLPASRPTLAPASSEIASGRQIATGVGDPDPTAEGLEPGEE